jgi:hypothetical protein
MHEIAKTATSNELLRLFLIQILFFSVPQIPSAPRNRNNRFEVRIKRGALRNSSNWAASLDHTDQDDNDGQQQQQVNEAAHRVRTHHPESPQYEQNYSDSPKHCETRFLGRNVDRLIGLPKSSRTSCCSVGPPCARQNQAKTLDSLPRFP